MRRLDLAVATLLCLQAGIDMRGWGQTVPRVTLPVYTEAVNASGENSRLRQMESIYQQQLRARHIPLLGTYLSNLQRLAAASPDVGYQNEISRVQAIIASGGIVDLNAAARALEVPVEMPTPSPMPPPAKSGRSVIALTPPLARLISPLPAGSASPTAAAVGKIEWRIDALPPGRYEVLLQYSLPTMDAEFPLEVQIGENVISRKMTLDRVTSKGAFRLMRVGRLELEKELRGETLRLSAGNEDSTLLQVREVVVNRAIAP